MKSKKEYFGEVIVASNDLIEKDVDKMQMEYYKTQGLEEGEPFLRCRSNYEKIQRRRGYHYF